MNPTYRLRRLWLALFLALGTLSSADESQTLPRKEPRLTEEAARRIRSQYPELQTVLTILDDEGEKYLHDFHMQPAAPAGA